MSAQIVTIRPDKDKVRVVGGDKAIAIYGEGGLAESIRKKKIARVSKLEGDGTVSIYCEHCHCMRGDGQEVVGDLLVTCPCTCHDDGRTKKTATYRGERGMLRPVITVDGKQLPFREDVRRIDHLRDWGPRSAPSARERLALDLAISVVGKNRALKVYKALAESLIKRLTTDSWKIDENQILRGIEAIEGVSQ